MTQEAARRAGGSHGGSQLELDVLEVLWEQVPFPRLPGDAPSELRDLVVDIENPIRVYAIHRAIRRHDLQLLIEKFVVQLRYGCGSDGCTTSSCFSCRRRLARSDPIRRYSPASARTLAIYLVSLDNPETRLCPRLHILKGPSDAMKPLIFPKPSTSTMDIIDGRSLKQSKVPAGRPETPKGNSTTGHRLSISEVSLGSSARVSQKMERCDEGTAKNAQCAAATSHVALRERPTRKDYRSFAANMFGTAAFKMLEWLTPANIQAISTKLEEAAKVDTTHRSTEDPDDGMMATPRTLSVDLEHPLDLPESPTGSGPSPEHHGSDSDHGEGLKNGQINSHGHQSLPDTTNNLMHSGLIRRNSSAHGRTPSMQRPQARISTDDCTTQQLDDPHLGIGSPRAALSPTELVSKQLVRTASKVSRQLSLEDDLEREDDEELAGINGDRNIPRSQHHRRESSPDHDGEVCNTDDWSSPTSGEPSDRASDSVLPASGSGLDNFLPQSLSCLNRPVIDLFCDVMQADGTVENHILVPESVKRFSRRSTSVPKHWKRPRATTKPYPANLRLEWKLFIEQSVFNVLSDPRAILSSFTSSGVLMDSQTLWYCMLRLTRIAPGLVFDSLWNASESLFAPPQSLQPSRSSTGKSFSEQSRSVTNKEAGQLLSVCFHALVAAAPLVTDSRQLLDVSRIRSHGLVLTESGAIARQPPTLCLQYEDAFSDGLALRLARRLFAAISTRKCFDDLAKYGVDSESATQEEDSVEVLLSHLEWSSGTQPALEFSFDERQIHEKRVPLLLLDWARTVMLKEWHGAADVPGDGPFGGSLTMIAAMHEKRNSLLLADAAFRVEYIGERLDAIEMPVAWLNFTTTKRKAHLLDHPYIFSSSSLVSYFRAINFSRMSRAFEESCSLLSRISAIIATDSLVTDFHQKTVLQEQLKTASSKFLILDIGRKTVISDAFDQLWRRQERELVKPLKVHLGEDAGEEGFDSGGVQQEFFRLAVAEALNPEYGAFAVDDRTRMAWFQPASLQPEWKFELIGLIVSLAVYNGLTLPITFPKALYRKLLGQPVTELHHISDGWPDLANGLTTLLEWDENDGTIEDVFARTYEFSVSMFDQPVSREMGRNQEDPWPQFSNSGDGEALPASNPDEAPLVTGDNRNAYVSDYIRYLTDISVAPQYEAFARGFTTCLRPKSLQLLSPNLLQSVVEGTQDIDVAELRRAARYVGWDATHRTVRDFWSIVKRYDDRMKHKLLEFVTASDRVPVGGMGNIQFVVQRNGEEEGEGGHLPTAYTCYGTLLLPEYRDKDVLRERMAMALENAQGFGFA